VNKNVKKNLVTERLTEIRSVLVHGEQVGIGFAKERLLRIVKNSQKKISPLTFPLFILLLISFSPPLL